jgi:hypothetical protein
MTEQIKLKPGVAEDGTRLVITNHRTGKRVPDEGEMFEVDATVNRRVRDRDLVPADEAAPASAAEAGSTDPSAAPKRPRNASTPSE